MFHYWATCDQYGFKLWENEPEFDEKACCFNGRGQSCRLSTLLADMLGLSDSMPPGGGVVVAKLAVELVNEEKPKAVK